MVSRSLRFVLLVVEGGGVLVVFGCGASWMSGFRIVAVSDCVVGVASGSLTSVLRVG